MHRPLFGDVRHGIREGTLRDTRRDAECPQAHSDPICNFERRRERAHSLVEVSFENLAERVAKTAFTLRFGGNSKALPMPIQRDGSSDLLQAAAAARADVFACRDAVRRRMPLLCATRMYRPAVPHSRALLRRAGSRRVMLFDCEHVVDHVLGLIVLERDVALHVGLVPV